MNKTKKALLAISLPIMLLVLSGCGSSPTTPVVTKPAPTNTQTEQTPSTTSATAPVAQALPPLPANNKAAIDTEVNGIDKDLQAADAAIAKDTTDPSLGL